MEDKEAVSSLSDLAERLFSKPPSVQNIAPESAVRYLNAAASDIGEGLIQQLLVSEHCNTPKDQREFNEHVTTGTVLHVLAFVGRSESVEWLLKNGASSHTFNNVGSTALHVAALRQHADIIKTLRFYHADSYSENRDHKTALDFCQDADDVKEALLSYRFSSESIEEEYLQERLPALLERVKSPKNTDDQIQALLCIRAEIRMATSSMTSVPKPLKLLREHFDELDSCYNDLVTDSPSKKLLADVLSVLAMATDDKAGRKCLNYRLQGSQEKVSSFGHPYIRRLCSQIPEEWLQRSSPESDLLALVTEICQYCLKYSAEAEACDLLMEIEKIRMIFDLVTEDISDRVCLYLTSCVKYVQEPENTTLLEVALQIHQKFKQYPQALRLALMINDPALIRKVFLECPDNTLRKQLAFMLGRQQVFLELDDTECEEVEDIADIMSNVHLNNNFLALARELDIMEPKVPEDIYKTHLEHARFSTANTVDSARANLSSSFVNGFVNAGFCTDKLLVADGNKWIYKNKGVGMMSAAASLGLILLWDVEGGLSEIDKFLYASEDHIKAGALLACGIVNVGVRNECDPALALLSDYVLHASSAMRLGAVIGLGLAYAGSARSDIIEVLTPVMWDANSSFEVVCLGALSCAMIAVGSCHGDLTESFLQIMMERDSTDLGKTHARYLALALALLYLGKQEAAELTIGTLKVIPEPLRAFATTLLDVCAYAGTGNVLKIQSLLHTCSEFYKSKDKEGEQAQEEGAGSTTEATPISGKPGEVVVPAVPTASVGGGDDTSGKPADKPADTPSTSATATATSDKTTTSEKGGGKKSSSSRSGGKDVEMKDGEATAGGEPGSIGEPGSHQAICVLGIALIAMGEDIGAEMALRTFNHLLHYGDSIIRRAVPLALSLLSTSNPQLPILDTLSKFSHDSDPTVARNAIFSMGLVGSGTNNARLAGLLRNLAQFYHKEPMDLFMVRLAQGLTHLGKGTLTLNPFHSDRMLMTPVAVAGLLSVLLSMLDANNIILKDAHYVLYYLTPAIQPRMLVTFNEELSPLSVNVRVGQAVDVVGQAGKPKTITGFQTHTTPVLLAYGERAELATEEYLPLTPIVEGFVILKKNPDYDES